MEIHFLFSMYGDYPKKWGWISIYIDKLWLIKCIQNWYSKKDTNNTFKMSLMFDVFNRDKIM